MSPIDPSLQRYMADTLRAPEPWEVPLAELRAGHASVCAELWGRAPEHVADVRDVAIGAAPGAAAVRVYRPGTEGSLPALVWYHGGGWTVGSLQTHDSLCRALAAGGPCCVVSVGYRLAPEYRFPAAVEDAWAGLSWTVDNSTQLGVDPGRIAVGGDSAGGNLAAVMALRARDEGVPIALQTLVYPVTDADFERESYREHADGLNLTRARMRWYWQQYMGEADPRDPRAAPLHARLGGVAPALVQIAEYDVLRSEGDAYARRLAEAGVPVTLTCYRGMLHGFLQMPALAPASSAALAEILEAVSRAGRTAEPTAR